MDTSMFIIVIGEEIVAEIPSSQIQHHPQIGTILRLETEAYSGTPGRYLEIQHAEWKLSHLDGRVVRDDLHIHCIEKEESP